MAAAQDAHHRLNQMLDLLPNGARIGAIKSILVERGLAVGTAVPPRATPTHLQLWSKIQPLLG
jgi:hypothetical protein